MGVPIWRPKSPPSFLKKRPKVPLPRGSSHGTDNIRNPGIIGISRDFNDLQRRPTIRRVGLRRRQTMENLHLYMGNPRRHSNLRLNEDALDSDLPGFLDSDRASEELREQRERDISDGQLNETDTNTGAAQNAQDDNENDLLLRTLERYPSIRYYGPDWQHSSPNAVGTEPRNLAEERDDHGNSDHYDRLEELIALADRSSAWRPPQMVTSLRLPSIESGSSLNETTQLQIRRGDVMEPLHSPPVAANSNAWIPTSASVPSASSSSSSASTSSVLAGDPHRPQVHFTDPVATNSTRVTYASDEERRASHSSPLYYYRHHMHRRPFENADETDF